MATRRLVELVLKGKDESQGAFKSVENSFKGVTLSQAKFTLGAGALTVALLAGAKQLAGYIHQIALLGDAMDDMSVRTGLAVENLSTLIFMVERGGGKAANAEAAMKRLARSMGAVQDGNTGATATFERLGISADRLVGHDGQLVKIETVLPMIANGLHGIQSQAERMDLAQSIFGRGGLNLLPALQEGEAGIRRVREEMQKFGGPMTAGFAGAAATYVESTDNLMLSIQRLKETLAEPFLAPFTDAINSLAGAIASGKNLITGQGSDKSGLSRAAGAAAGVWTGLGDVYANAGAAIAGAFGPRAGRGVGTGDPYQDYLSSLPPMGPPPPGAPTAGVGRGPRNITSPYEFSGSSMDQRFLDRLYARDNNTLDSFGGEGMMLGIGDGGDFGASSIEASLKQLTSQSDRFAQQFATSIGTGLANSILFAQDFSDTFQSIIMQALSFGIGQFWDLATGGIASGVAGGEVGGSTKSMPSSIVLGGSGAGSAMASKAYSRGFI